MKRKQWILTGLIVLGCLAVVTTGAVAGKPPKPTPIPTPTPAPPSCEGCTIAFVKTTSLNLTERPLMLTDEFGSVTTVLHQGSGIETGEPAWSPDGEWIAFNRRDNATNDLGLFIIRSNGSAPPVRITDECSFDGRMSGGSIHGPTWQPNDEDGNGMLWLVYADSPPDDPACGVDNARPLHLWAIEVGFGSPGCPYGEDVCTGRHVAMTFPSPGTQWNWMSPSWSMDGARLAVVRYLEGNIRSMELLIFEVEFADDGVPFLDTSPWRIAPPEAEVWVNEPSWCNTSDCLIANVTPFDYSHGTDLWRCDLEFGDPRTASWTNLTPDIEGHVRETSFSPADGWIVLQGVNLGSSPSQDGLFVGEAVEPFVPQLILAARGHTRWIQPDWRPFP